jgi:hypothetical protein
MNGALGQRQSAISAIGGKGPLQFFWHRRPSSAEGDKGKGDGRARKLHVELLFLVLSSSYLLYAFATAQLFVCFEGGYQELRKQASRALA